MLHTLFLSACLFAEVTSLKIASTGIQPGTRITGFANDGEGNFYISGFTSVALDRQRNFENLYISRNRGESWESIRTPFAGIWLLAVDPEDPRVIYAEADSALQRSTDGGATWRRLRDSAPSALVIDPSDRRILIAVDGDKLIRSGDGGGTWQTIRTVPGFGELRIDPRGSGAVVFGSLISRDRGLSWRPLGLEGEQLLVAFQPHKPGALYATMYERLRNRYAFYRSTDGNNWIEGRYPIDLGDFSSALFPDPAQPGRVWLAGPSGIVRSDDEGNSWIAVSSENTYNLAGCGSLLADGGSSFRFSSNQGATWKTNVLASARVGFGAACTGYATPYNNDSVFGLTSFLTKYSRTGERLWLRYLPEGAVYGLDVNPRGDIALQQYGWYRSYTPLIRRFDSAGNVVFTVDSLGYNIGTQFQTVLDNAGQLYVSESFVPFSTTISKWSATGTRLYSKSPGARFRVTAIAAGNQDQLFVTGFNSTTPSTFVWNRNGESIATIAALSGDKTPPISGLLALANGDVVAAGYIGATSSFAPERVCGGSRSTMWITRLGSERYDPQWTSRLGAAVSDLSGLSLKEESSGGGVSARAVQTETFAPFGKKLSGASSLVFFDPDGRLQWSTPVEGLTLRSLTGLVGLRQTGEGFD